MDDTQLDYSMQMLLEDPDAFENKSRLRIDTPYYGFDNSSGKTWIYPTNYPIRSYQRSISQKALFNNTLVVLPTGLGKTFIAAVVMYNFYRWYPRGKVIFMAPARPLVSQQIDACYNIMGIPKSDTVEITGRKAQKDRQELWKSKKVFYATPQAVISDMLSPEHDFPVNDIRLVVIDEAHKAKGKYAYCEVIKYISEKNRNFRVLALSATPGKDLADVREISQNLLISHIEVRYENSIDVAEYTFQKMIKTEVVPFDSRIKRIKASLVKILEPYVEKLKEMNLLTGNAGSHSKGWIIMQQKEFHRLAIVEKPPNYTEISSTFSTCMSLYHSLEVLERHGCRMFLNSFLDEQNRSGFKYFVNQNDALRLLLDDLKQEMGIENIVLDRTLNSSVTENPMFDFGHPKFEVLEHKLVEHFKETPDSKVIVFCELRETVLLIDILLSKHKPLIKPRKMVGQGSSSGIKAVTQKEQLAVMKEFREGKSNCLIATCVVEEGIDVGDVMMIVCFDSSSNPTRFVQRIGRTGRKQRGKVLMLVAEGREHEILKKVVSQKDKTIAKLANKKETEWFLYKESPRMVPKEFNPECIEVCFDIKEAEETEPQQKMKKKVEKATKGGKKGKVVKEKKTKNPKTDIKNYFKPRDLASSEDENPPEAPISNETSILSTTETKIKPNRTLPKPKMPISNNSTLINFTQDDEKLAVIEELNESDSEWEKLQQIQKSMRKNSVMEYENDKAIHAANDIAVEFKQYLVDSKENRAPNYFVKQTEEYLNRILKENLTNSDKKRTQMLLDVVKKVEEQLRDEKIVEIQSLSEQKIVETEDFVPKIESQPVLESQNIFHVNSQPSKYLDNIDESLLTKTFDRRLTEKPSNSTPISAKIVKTPKKLKQATLNFNDSPSMSCFMKAPAESTPIMRKSVILEESRVKKMTPRSIIPTVKEKKQTEEEVLNSLGLKSIDDLFPDADDFLLTPDENPKFEQKSIQKSTLNVSKKDEKSVLSDLTNKSDKNFTKNEIFKADPVKIESPIKKIPVKIASNKRSAEKMIPEDAEENKSKRQKLEFVDLDNIFGDSDDDLFGETVCERSSPLKDKEKSFKDVHETQNYDEIDSQGPDSPTTILEKSLSKLNNSLSMFLADELNEIQKDEESNLDDTQILSASVIENAEKTIINVEKFHEKQISKVFKTPPKAGTSNITLNDTSPSLFRCRMSSQIPNPTKNVSNSAPMFNKTHKSPVSSPLTQAIKPINKRNKRQRKILSDSEDENDDFEQEIQSEPLPKAQKTSKNNKSRRKCAFLDTEAGISDDDSDEDDFDETGFSDLHGFVVDEPSIMNETNMFAKYVQSTRSPHRFQRPRELKPFIPEEIYSQAVPIEASQYDLNDSFVTEEDVEHLPEATQSYEMSELEIAEAILEAERKERKRKRRN
ncbi:Fanconi anemia group M protein [Culicoides brevitarsis]|uniref:Fanconi anemia group M protein n=1 Tax=Culicoides brevitarsis TaxID=469753 RepID=UPI00307B3461